LIDRERNKSLDSRSLLWSVGNDISGAFFSGLLESVASV
jgi:hypothetical protein